MPGSELICDQMTETPSRAVLGTSSSVIIQLAYGRDRPVSNSYYICVLDDEYYSTSVNVYAEFFPGAVPPT